MTPSKHTNLCIMFCTYYRLPTLILAPARRSNPVLAPDELFWRPFFVRPKKIILVKRRGKSWRKWFKLLFCFILMNLFLSGLSKTETGTKTAPRVSKLGVIYSDLPFSSVENDKKRRFRNLKNLLKALQQFLSFPTCPGCYEPPNKMQS